jgi:hypothetical protein
MATSLYDPSNNTMVTDPASTANFYSGANAFRITNGPRADQWMMICGNNTINTFMYDENNIPTVTLPVRPDLPITQGSGGFLFSYQPGKWLIIRGGGQNGTAIYDESLDQFSSGPSLSGNLQNGASASYVSSGVNAGKWLIIHGNSSASSSWYDPGTVSIVAGPTLTNSAGLGGFSKTITTGIHTGKVLIVHGGNKITSSYYDPITDTVIAGPQTPVVVNDGGRANTNKSGSKKDWLLVPTGYGDWGFRWYYFVP